MIPQQWARASSVSLEDLSKASTSRASTTNQEELLVVPQNAEGRKPKEEQQKESLITLVDCRCQLELNCSMKQSA